MAAQRTQIVVRLLLVNSEQQYLFLRQKASNGGKLTLPGGRVESEESAREALIREVFEEIGAVIQMSDLSLVHVCHKLSLLSKQVVLTFKATKWTGVLANKEPDKFKGIKWVSAILIPEALPDILQHTLAHIREGIIYSEFIDITKGNNIKKRPDIE